MQRFAQQTDHLAHRLRRQHPVYRLQQHAERLGQFRSRLAVTGRSMVPRRQLQIDRANDRLLGFARRLVPERQQRLSALARTLHAVSPLPTLDRGYAILTSEDGAGISSIDDTRPGVLIRAQVRDGRIDARVTETAAEAPGERPDP
jgi:exodeoxyribonuclease VII large subunit